MGDNRKSLGDRMKSQYEDRTRYLLPRRTYTLLRLDGKAFHTYCRGLSKPYDLEFMQHMDETALHLCENIQNAQIGFVQSDEISILMWDAWTLETDAWFGGNVQKIVSVAASLATQKFNALRPGKPAHFDARTWTIPEKTEVYNYFVWRQKDAISNSIQLTAQNLYSPKQLHGVQTEGLLKLIQDKGSDWGSQPKGFCNGRVLMKIKGWVKLDAPVFTENPEFLTMLIPRHPKLDRFDDDMPLKEGPTCSGTSVLE